MKGHKGPLTPPRQPAQKSAKARNADPAGASFRTRYDMLEREREALLQRLELHQVLLEENPAARRAQTLLTSTFRRVSLSQRASVLQAAAWLIQIIEMSSKIM
jgi:hypothetical protein